MGLFNRKQNPAPNQPETDRADARQSPGPTRPSYLEFIPKAGACLVSRNVLSGAGRVKWMVRGESKNPADNGWRIMSAIDTEGFLASPDCWKITDFNEVCNIEPALIGIYDFPVGSDLELVDDGKIRIIDGTTGREIGENEFFVPPQFWN